MDPYEMHDADQPPSSFDGLSSFTRIMGFSFFASLFSSAGLLDSAKLLVLGSLIETGRRLFQWLIERFRFQYSITAQFDEGDPAYEWMILFLTQEKVWRRARDFRVNAKNSKRKWGVSMKLKPTDDDDDNADYVPTYEMPQIFHWNGYWLEIKRSKGMQMMTMHHGAQSAATIYVTIYTRDMNALSTLVEEAHRRYVDMGRPHVTVYIADMPTYGPGFVWNNVKRKARRPLNSIILLDGVIESLVQDAQEFLAAEDWYVDAGIPYRRGYLLFGPPGTGKTSTIYALAGELGLEIYALSLSSGFVDDSFLQKAASSIPKNSILLIEDIDCAFPSRSEEDDDISPYTNPNLLSLGGMVTPSYLPGGRVGARSAVTLSGLLNVLDGVGSEEGKFFFATTNHIDRLDPALLRPGRIDRKIQYELATKDQASALFLRFFFRSWKHDRLETNTAALLEKEKPLLTPSDDLVSLSQSFAAHIPTHTFSTAELQGYLLSYKHDPVGAVDGVVSWVECELEERRVKEEREERRRRRIREGKIGAGAGMAGGVGAGGVVGSPVGMVMGGPVVGGGPVSMGLDVRSGLAPPSPACVDANEPIVGAGVPPGLNVLLDEEGSKSDTETSDGPSTLTSPF